MKLKNFQFYELVTPYAYWIWMKRGGIKTIIKDGVIIGTWVSDRVWMEFNIDFLKEIQKLRMYLKKEIHINNWHKNKAILNLIVNDYKEDLFEISVKGSTDDSIFLNRGKRLMETEIGADLSLHISGNALDFDVKGMSANAVRNYIIENQARFPYIKRLEKDVNWVHMDSLDTGKNVIELI